MAKPPADHRSYPGTLHPGIRAIPSGAGLRMEGASAPSSLMEVINAS